MVWASSDVSAGDDVLAEQYNDLRADTQDVLDEAVPLGSITMWAGGTGDVPSGWNLCNGGAISRTTYSDLYTLIGTTFGSGDGSTTFNVPDMRDRFVVGAGTSYSRNSKGGSNTVNSSHSHTVNSHSHSIAQHSHTVSSHRHYTGAHSHGSGSYRAEIVRTSQYNMYLNQASSSGWTSDTLINLYNSSGSSTGQSSGVVVTGSSSSANAGYTDYQSPGTSTAGATSTGNSSPSTNSAGSSSLENRPPYIGMYYIIKIE
jgi:microcystin-dependent protein